jgi:hypothetical protein
MKIKTYNDRDDLGEHLTFNGKHVRGSIWSDGSGMLEVRPKKYICPQDCFISESGNHKDRVALVKHLADVYTAAYKELKKLPKIKLKKGKSYD